MRSLFCPILFLALVVTAFSQKSLPELKGDTWFNTPDNKPMKLADLRGKPVIVHFWTFACINCKHNLATYEKWREKWSKDGVQVIGVHTPELEMEKSTANVKKAIADLRIKFPVLIDTKHENWDRWGVRYWPSIAVLDGRGKIVYTWEGELEYNNAGGTAKVEGVVNQLLKQGKNGRG